VNLSEPLDSPSEGAFKLHRDKRGKYFLCIVEHVIRGESQAPDPDAAPKIVSLDPGVNTFLTGYEPSTGRYFELGGKGDHKYLRNLGKHLDNLIRRANLCAQRRKRYRMRRAQKRLQSRIRNLVDEAHKKWAGWLVRNYELVLLPFYEQKSKVKRGKSKLRKVTKRDMSKWSFYRFKEYIQWKALQHNCTLLLVSENHTTMTCGECGTLNKVEDRVLRCAKCATTLPRDWNAARNVFLRYISGI
jgi:putative transposase